MGKDDIEVKSIPGGPPILGSLFGMSGSYEATNSKGEKFYGDTEDEAREKAEASE